jgi:hypothetical protein
MSHIHPFITSRDSLCRSGVCIKILALPIVIDRAEVFPYHQFCCKRMFLSILSDTSQVKVVSVLILHLEHSSTGNKLNTQYRNCIMKIWLTPTFSSVQIIITSWQYILNQTAISFFMAVCFRSWDESMLWRVGLLTFWTITFKVKWPNSSPMPVFIFPDGKEIVCFWLLDVWPVGK